MSIIRFLAVAGAVVFTACAEAPTAAPAFDSGAISAKSVKPGASSIPVETVLPGVLPLGYQLHETDNDPLGRASWVEEVSTGYDSTGEPVGSVVIGVVALDTATVRSTIRTIRQRTGWTAEVPKTATYDNKAVRVTWRRGKLSVTVSVLHVPGRTVDDHGIVR